MKLNQHCSFSIGATLYEHGLKQIYCAKISKSTAVPLIAKIGQLIRVTEESYLCSRLHIITASSRDRSSKIRICLCRNKER